MNSYIWPYGTMAKISTILWVFSLTTAPQILSFENLVLTIPRKYGILTAEEKLDTGWTIQSPDRVWFKYIFACSFGSKSGLTTPLTIYRLGLCGNSAYKSIGKHRFWTKKHQKVNKSSQKNDGVFVRVLETASSPTAWKYSRRLSPSHAFGSAVSLFSSGASP